MASDLDEQLVRITAPHFCAGLILGDDKRVKRAAPILKWSLNKRIESIMATANRLRWQMEFLNE